VRGRQSELLREWLATLPPDTSTAEAEVRRLEGLEVWSTAPGVAAPVAPSPHKIALVLVVVAFVMVSVLTPACGPFSARTHRRSREPESWSSKSCS